MPDFVVTNKNYVMNFLFFILASFEDIVCASPSASTFLIIIEGSTTLPWIRQQPTHCSHFLNRFKNWKFKNWQMSAYYSFILPIFFVMQKSSNICKINVFCTFWCIHQRVTLGTMGLSITLCGWGLLKSLLIESCA